ncbi:MAG: hypothetical protein ACOC57_04635 [Acidobacteriota bacterium]
MRQKIWVKKTTSFNEAGQFEDDYYLSMSAEERLTTVQFLREEYWKIRMEHLNEGGKRLSRVFKIIKQAQS